MEFDKIYETQTGLSPFLTETLGFDTGEECYRIDCAVFLEVDRGRQIARLYIEGEFKAEWLVSTGGPGHETPDLDHHPNGRIYDRYSSSSFPGGNYAGLGNMPYAVFIVGPDFLFRKRRNPIRKSSGTRSIRG